MLRTNSVPSLFRNSPPKYLPESYSKTVDYGIAILRVIDPETIIFSEVSATFLHLTGQDEKALANRNLYQNPIWNDEGQLWQAIGLCLSDQKTQFLNWNFHIQDEARTLNCTIVPTFNSEKSLSGITLILSHNTDEIDFAEHIRKFNYYDKLTGLPNQTFLNEKTDSEFAKNIASGQVAILLVNILKFQRINESFGYHLGDDIIQKVARRLNFRLPRGALLTRFNGDKFAILLTDENYGVLQGEAQSLARVIHQDMTEPLIVDDQKINLLLTIGIAVGSAPLNDSSQLIQQAHIAMLRLNIKSRERTLVYKPGLKIRAHSRLKLENDLRDALRNKDLTLNYQPLISLKNGELIGFEALCRWNHPTRGMISPLEFIPLAEETGLIIPLGKWVLEEACKSLSTWLDKYPICANLVINVNVSGLQLWYSDFVITTQEVLAKTGLNSHQLTLEITETTLVENAEVVRDILLDLKSLGVGLAIDDFGTGYSSLSYLNQFPVDTLKIDKSFVSRMNVTEDSYKIIRIITSLAQTLGMKAVAEGIEQKDQVVALKELGCQTGQGFLFSKPLSFDDAEKYIQNETSTLV